MKKHSKWLMLASLLYLVVLIPQDAHAMHIMEGYLPKFWALFWWVVYLPFLIIGLRKLTKLTEKHPEQKLLLALAGAFVFLLSSLKIPSVTGSCSHPTGVGLGAVLFGPWPMAVLGLVVLLFQAVLLAHGGLTSLGANAFSMAVVGPFIAYYLFRALKKSGVNNYVAVFAAAAIGNLSTYVITSIQLALAHPAGDFGGQVVTYLAVFALTQIPIAIAEGILTALLYEKVYQYEEGIRLETIH